MHVVRLTAENFLRLAAVEIEPDPEGGLVVIGGRNAQGKSPVLKAIMAALGGKVSDPQPVHEGAERAEVSVRLEGEGLSMPYTVRRTFTVAGGQRLEVLTDAGDEKKRPQQVLDSFLGDLTFDPLAFAGQTPKDQRRTLLEAAGVDLTALDARAEQLKEARLTRGRELRAAKGSYEAMPVPALDLPDAPLDAAAIAQEVMDAEQTNRENVTAREDAEVLAVTVISAKGLAATCEFALEVFETEVLQRRAVLTQKVVQALDNAATIEAEAAEAQAKVAAYKDVDVAPIRERLANIETVNAQIRDRTKRLGLAEYITGLSADHAQLEGRLMAVDEAKAKLLDEARIPCPGLGISEHGITLNGLPFEQASQAETLRASVAVGMALNPDLRIMLIEDGSLLDTDNLGLLAELAQERDYHIWIERVGDTAAGFVIEDGRVLAQGAQDE